MQIDPGPIPTLTISTPLSAKNFAALPVAIFPTHKVEFFNFFLIFMIIVKTFFVCPCAVSITIKSVLAFDNSSALSMS